MNIKETFIKNLIEELNDYNQRSRIPYDQSSLDVYYIVSVVDQQIENCKEFMEDITNHNYRFNGYTEDITQGYTNGSIEILIEKLEEEKESEYMVDAYYNYSYKIEFTYDERNWGYCQCSHEDKGYDKEHGCCGMGCDWDAPSFRLTKEINLNCESWVGQEKDYWEYEKQFKANQENKNIEVEKYEKERKRQYLLESISQLQEQLAELNEVV